MRATRLLALAALLSAHVAIASSPRTVDYLYLEANEGGSSGGHVAIRFADEVYHFQHQPPGVLRLHRDEWEPFRYAYGLLQNRTMHASRAEVSDATFTRLRRQFSERYLIDDRVFAQRDALRDDRELLDLLLARRRGEPAGGISVPAGGISVPAAGFFFPHDDAAVPSPTVASLRADVLRADGPAAIRRKVVAIRHELEGLGLPTEDPATSDFTETGYPAFRRTFSARYRDLVTALLALQALDGALPLRADARWQVSGVRLDDGERRVLAAHAERLAAELTALLHSQRPDWGFAFLVGLARLEAVRASMDTGTLILLDAFPPESEVMPPSFVRQHRDALFALRAEALDDLTQARSHLRERSPVDEAVFAELETAGNRLLELDAALTDGKGLRVPSGALVPSRDVRTLELVLTDIGEDDLARAVAAAGATERRFAARLRDRYGYNLFTRNCVSEVLRTVEAAGADPGGHLDARRSLDFIPFVSARTVDGSWNVVERTTLASYRRTRLDAMYDRENALLVGLRESNVLTSTIYRRNADDSVFLFFTDDRGVLRPLLGTVNLAAGMAAVAIGFPLLPFDRGHTLWAGIRGAVFSLPELAFVSLRKGSFDYVPPDQRPPDPDAIHPQG